MAESKSTPAEAKEARNKERKEAETKQSEERPGGAILEEAVEKGYLGQTPEGADEEDLSVKGVTSEAQAKDSDES